VVDSTSSHLSLKLAWRLKSSPPPSSSSHLSPRLDPAPFQAVLPSMLSLPLRAHQQLPWCLSLMVFISASCSSTSLSRYSRHCFSRISTEAIDCTCKCEVFLPHDDIISFALYKTQCKLCQVKEQVLVFKFKARVNRAKMFAARTSSPSLLSPISSRLAWDQWG
jgi:hypothetical protein